MICNNSNMIDRANIQIVKRVVTEMGFPNLEQF
jgi:hypothetical protein